MPVAFPLSSRSPGLCPPGKRPLFHHSRTSIRLLLAGFGIAVWLLLALPGHAVGNGCSGTGAYGRGNPERPPITGICSPPASSGNRPLPDNLPVSDREKHGRPSHTPDSSPTDALRLLPEASEPAGVQNPVRLTLDLRRRPLAEIFAAIEQQSGYIFSYESSLLDDLPPVTFQAHDEPLASCLDRLLGSFSLSYSLSGAYIILKRRPRLCTLNGFIRDSASSESLINASVHDHVSRQGVTTNPYGFYSLTLPAGRVRLHASYVGYHTKEICFDLRKDTVIDLFLAPSGLLKEIVIEGLPPTSEILNSRVGGLEFSSRTIRQVPALFGEPDLFRTLQQTPGVSPGTEGLTGLYVRGGNNDENLYLIDGNPVYHVNHVGGLFSTFNPDAVKNVEFYRGSFPARYGGRLSSVVDVRMKDGDMHNYHGSLSVGLLSAAAAFEGPLIRNRTSFTLAFRRTWLDAITAPAIAILNKIHKDRSKAGYSFYDLNGKINHIFSERSRMYLSVYAGQDRVRWGAPTDSAALSDLKWRWGNFIGSVNWNYVFNNRLFANLTASYSRFQSRLWNKKEDYTDETFKKLRSARESVRGSYIQDIGYRLDFDYMPAPAHRIRFGSDYLFHQYRPEQHWTNTVSMRDEEREEDQIVYSDQYVPAHEWSLYAEDDWRISSRWRINAGVRLGVYHVQGRTYASFQPRLSARYRIASEWSAKVAYDRMNQYVHQLSNSYLNLPSDIWVPVTEKVEPMSAHQFSAGLYHRFLRHYQVSVEGYYKKMNHLIEYQDGASLYPKYTHWDDKIAMGEGRGYGVETMIRKPDGRLSGWISYTLSWADRVFQDGTINSGLRFPAKYDNRHKFNIAAVYRLTPKIELSAAWTYMTGNRVTVSIDSYPSVPSIPGKDPGTGINPEWPPSYEPIFRKNGIRLGNYHRLDVGVNFYHRTKKGHTGIWNVSLYNTYSRMNPFKVQSVSRGGPDSWRVVQTGYVPIVPSVSYTYKF